MKVVAHISATASAPYRDRPPTLTRVDREKKHAASKMSALFYGRNTLIRHNNYNITVAAAENAKIVIGAIMSLQYIIIIDLL